MLASVDDEAQRSPLHAAALDDDVNAIKALLSSGASPDAQDEQGLTPLHLAAQEYSVAATTALLIAGAAVDTADVFGNSALFVAVYNSNGRGELINVLRSHGADPLRSNLNGQTPVGLARLVANYDVAQFFEDLPE